MEPWDGPAAIAFTDGKVVGATLDRNGLRPARYIVTKDNMIVVASEVGCVPDLKEEDIIMKRRLKPGRILLVDLEKGKLITNSRKYKLELAKKLPYGKWVKKLINLKDLKYKEDNSDIS